MIHTVIIINIKQAQIELVIGRFSLLIDLSIWYLLPQFSNLVLGYQMEHSEFNGKFLCLILRLNYRNKKGRENKAYRKRVLSGKE